MSTAPYASAKTVFWVVDNGSSHAGQRSIGRLQSRRSPAASPARIAANRGCRPARRGGSGIVDSERRGLWAYYYVLPDSLKEISQWLS